jgi:hypothetical protein
MSCTTLGSKSNSLCFSSSGQFLLEGKGLGSNGSSFSQFLKMSSSTLSLKGSSLSLSGFDSLGFQFSLVSSSNGGLLSGSLSTHILSLESSLLFLINYHGLNGMSLLVDNLVLTVRLVQDLLDFSSSMSKFHGLFNNMSSSASCFSDDNRLGYSTSSDNSPLNYTLLVSSLHNLTCFVGLSDYLLDVLGMEDLLDLLLGMSELFSSSDVFVSSLPGVSDYSISLSLVDSSFSLSNGPLDQFLGMSMRSLSFVDLSLGSSKSTVSKLGFLHCSLNKFSSLSSRFHLLGFNNLLLCRLDQVHGNLLGFTSLHLESVSLFMSREGFVLSMLSPLVKFPDFVGFGFVASMFLHAVHFLHQLVSSFTVGYSHGMLDVLTSNSLSMSHHRIRTVSPSLSQVDSGVGYSLTG